MMERKLKEVQGLVWHEERMKGCEYGGTVMYS
jgi:hypothetical protein